jgi:hypothetical protein
MTRRGRGLYRKRSPTVEPVSGQTKHVRGIGRFLLRGPEGAPGECLPVGRQGSWPAGRTIRSSSGGRGGPAGTEGATGGGRGLARGLRGARGVAPTSPEGRLAASASGSGPPAAACRQAGFGGAGSSRRSKATSVWRPKQATAKRRSRAQCRRGSLPLLVGLRAPAARGQASPQVLVSQRLAVVRRPHVARLSAGTALAHGSQEGSETRPAGGLIRFLGPIFPEVGATGGGAVSSRRRPTRRPRPLPPAGSGEAKPAAFGGRRRRWRPSAGGGRP